MSELLEHRPYVYTVHRFDQREGEGEWYYRVLVFRRASLLSLGGLDTYRHQEVNIGYVTSTIILEALENHNRKPYSEVQIVWDFIDREIGEDPTSGKKVFVVNRKYGPAIQLGELEDAARRYAHLPLELALEGVSLKQALKLLDFPRDLGQFEGEKVVAAIGELKGATATMLAA